MQEDDGDDDDLLTVLGIDAILFSGGRRYHIRRRIKNHLEDCTSTVQPRPAQSKSNLAEILCTTCSSHRTIPVEVGICECATIPTKRKFGSEFSPSMNMRRKV